MSGENVRLRIGILNRAVLDRGREPSLGRRPRRATVPAAPHAGPRPLPGRAPQPVRPEQGVVFYNDRHPDYLLVKEDPASLLDYLATLVAKEYVVYNNPRSAPDDLAEEMVRMLIRVRRRLPRKV